MNYWLFKSEPSSWSWSDQEEAGKKGEGWDGVRNYQASNNMKKMKVGDYGFFYHSVTEKRIMGIVEVIKEYHPDPTDNSKKFGMVRVKAVRRLPVPVTLSQIKNSKVLFEFQMIKQARLSVVPVRKKEWNEICKMANLKNL
ncbi:EVE domain-containing protein [Alphaproteobacteria bacterium]|nr:EVE domain-containing protein [Alphaproteobacteria bacterium]